MNGNVQKRPVAYLPAACFAGETAGEPAMNDDSVLVELEETLRELWQEIDVTLAGYARMVDRLGREERARFLAEQGGKSGEGKWTPVGEGAMAVCEGEGSEYGAKGEG